MKRFLGSCLLALTFVTPSFAFQPPTIGSESAIVEGNQVYGRENRISPPKTETIVSGATITADACSGLKRVSAAGAVSTSTTFPFTAPNDERAGCNMQVCNVGANTITIKAATSFASVSGADVSLAAGSCLNVISTAVLWHQVAAVVANVTPTATATPTNTPTNTPTSTPTSTPTP